MTLRHKLQFSRSRIDAAGRELMILRSAALTEDQLPEQALRALNDWRSFHTFPLNSIAVVLKTKARKLKPDALVVERLKRTRSILAKLLKKGSMRLTQMQDIGGCRAVLDSIEQVYELADSYKNGRGIYEVVHVDDYIAAPKESGYRSVHLILRYHSRKYPEFSKLLLEIQVRTVVQHAWATAVETVGAVIGQALKSSEGEEKWLQYFQYASLALESMENSQFTKLQITSFGNIAQKLAALDKELQVSKKLQSYRAALKATENPAMRQKGYYLLLLLPEQRELKIQYFPIKKAEEAYREYEKAERLLPLYASGPQLSLFPELENLSGAQAVLVGAESFNSLRQCFPNYYLDTEFFLSSIEKFVRRNKRRK